MDAKHDAMHPKLAVQGANPGSVTITGTLSSGGPFIQTSVIPTCLDGTVATSVPVRTAC